MGNHDGDRSSFHSYDEDTPPPYEFIAGNTLSGQNVNMRDDGRIDIDLNSRLSRTLSKLIIPAPEKCGKSHTTPPLRLQTRPICDLKLNIVMQVVGSRGDVQPFIALGNELRRHGHRVRLATHGVFEGFVRKSGLEFYSIGGDPAELMAYMVKNPGLIPSMQSVRAGDIQKKRVMIAEILKGCWRSCIEPDEMTGLPFVADAIIANPPSFAHVHCAQALGVPVHLMFTMPWSSTRAFPHPLANLKNVGADPSIANYISYGVVEWMTWQGLGDIINEWRKSIDLEAVPAMEAPGLATSLKIPFTYCWSPALVPKPIDWPSYIDVCGFFFRDPPDYKPPTELTAFLTSGSMPIYIGFGSIVVDDPDKLTKTILSAIESTGVRAIVSRGWSKLGGPATRDIFYIDDCPHEWLFQHVSAVIHHGGAGTTACGLLNGRPTTIVPFFGDQPFWGNMVAAAGAGPQPIPHSKLNAENLADAIRFCLRPEAAGAAYGISVKMKAENGVSAAVDSFHANLPIGKMRCDIFPDQPAAWKYKKGKQPIKLSKLAVEILGEHLKLDPKDLKLYEPKPIIIENRRWDPATGTASAALGTATDMVKATSDMFVKPYQVYQRETAGNSPAETSSNRSPPGSSSASIKTNAGSFNEKQKSTSTSPTSGVVMTGKIAAATAQGFGNFVKHYSKGVIVDIPLAATEGFRSIPKLYGEEVKEHEHISGVKSGFAVAGKTFVQGMSEGLTDIFVHPYKGGKEQGALGAAKGILTGTIGTTTKLGSAMFGLVAYPGQGICKSIAKAVKSKTRKQIIEAKSDEGRYHMADVGDSINRAIVIADFDRLMHRKTEL